MDLKMTIIDFYVNHPWVGLFLIIYFFVNFISAIKDYVTKS